MKTRFELDVDGKKPFNIGLISIGEYQSSKNITFSELVLNIQENPFKYVPELMFWSMDYECKRKGVDCLSWDEFIDWLDDNGSYNNKSFKEFIEIWGKWLNQSVPQEDVEDTKDSKKK